MAGVAQPVGRSRQDFTFCRGEV